MPTGCCTPARAARVAPSIPPLGEVTRFADLVTADTPAHVDLRDLASGAIARTTSLDHMDDAWLGPGGELVVSAGGTPAALWRSVHGELQRALFYVDGAQVGDVDPVTGTALLVLGGDANIYHLHDATAGLALPMPYCDDKAPRCSSAEVRAR